MDHSSESRLEIPAPVKAEYVNKSRDPSANRKKPEEKTSPWNFLKEVFTDASPS